VALFTILVVVPRWTRAAPGVAGLPSVTRDVPATRELVGAPGVTPHSFAYPTLSKTQIAFTFGGEVWIVPREGGTARRLVTGQLSNHRPLFATCSARRTSARC